jgi:hypothetical protein
VDILFRSHRPLDDVILVPVERVEDLLDPLRRADRECP